MCTDMRAAVLPVTTKKKKKKGGTDIEATDNVVVMGCVMYGEHVTDVSTLRRQGTFTQTFSDAKLWEDQVALVTTDEKPLLECC
jgi:hypothetical protein